MIHFTHKFGEIKDGYQYCVICGIAGVAPCVHNWEIYSRTDIYGKDELPNNSILTQKCVKCGELQSYSIQP